MATEIVVDAAVIKRTQQTLGKYVKKPALSEKLLRKPPFRFLHDVFNVVIKDTGCFAGLYTPAELDYENIKDRDEKLRFLKKMIDVINLIAAGKTSVRASKIVCGQEAEKTNELLQLIGEVIEKQLDWQSAVAQVNGNDAVAANAQVPKAEEKPKETKTKEKAKDKPKEAKVKEKKEEKPKRITPTTVQKVKTKEKERDKDKDSKDRAKEKQSKTLKPKQKNKTPSPTVVTPTTNEQAPKLAPPITDEKPVEKKKAKPAEVEKPKEKQQSETVIDKPMETKPAAPSPPAAVTADPETKQEEQKRSSPSKEQTERRKSSGGSRRSSAKKQTRDQQEALPKPEEEKTAEIAPIEAVLPIQREEGNVNIRRESTFARDDSKEAIVAHQPSPTQRPRTSLRPPSARAASARPGAPRKRNRNVEIILQPKDELITDAGVKVTLESFGNFGDDEGNELVIIEDANAETGLDQRSAVTTSDDTLLEQQGHLVQQILETQKELVQNDDPTAAERQQGERLKSGSLGAGRESSARNMHNLQDVIQSLTKSVNPFGKLMDFLPEDTDAMQLEMAMWRETYQQAASELKREQSLTESATEPMKEQLLQIDANIREYEELVDASRMKILQSSQKILRMLMEQ